MDSLLDNQTIIYIFICTDILTHIYIIHYLYETYLPCVYFVISYPREPALLRVHRRRGPGWLPFTDGIIGSINGR